jgi:hypothetical protein
MVCAIANLCKAGCVNPAIRLHANQGARHGSTGSGCTFTNTKEGVLRQDTYREGRYWDTIVMAILREEWETHKAAER